MKAIIHIGTAKTGSTSIQKWLFSNFDALEAEGVYSNEGVFRMIRGHGRDAELRHLVFQVAKDELGADEKTAWMGPAGRNIAIEGTINENCQFMTEQFEKLSECPGIFICSFESLHRCNEVQIKALEKYLSRFFRDRTYVVYIRNTVDFLISFYSEQLRNNLVFEYSTQPYSAFLRECVNNIAPYGPERSLNNLMVWDEILGGRLNVRLLESNWLINGDLIEDFASLASVATFRKPPRKNESFAAEYIEYVRYLNQEFRDDLPSKIRWKAVRILRNASSGKPKLAASDAQAKSIRDLHRGQEEKIRKRFFPDRKFLFSQKSYGDGVAPPPLTERRKAEIETEIREKLEVWVPHELAASGDFAA